MRGQMGEDCAGDAVHMLRARGYERPGSSRRAGGLLLGGTKARRSSVGSESISQRSGRPSSILVPPIGL